MKFIALLYSDEQKEAQLGEDEFQALIEKHRVFTENHGDAIIGGEALQPTDSALSIKKDGDGFSLVPGPFAPTPVQLGGYYLLDCDSFEDALAICKKLPLTEDTIVEVRPIMEV